MFQLPECEKAPDYISPTQEWQRSKVKDFSDLRMYIEQFRDEIKKHKRKRKELCEKLVSLI